MKRVELLAPAADMSKLMTALHFGADAVIISDPGVQIGRAHV